MSDSIKVCFVIPAYNEASVISKVVSDLNLALKSEPYNFKIVVVDDGSKDNTANISSKAGATIIKHILNSGAGSATATGLSYAQQNNFDIAITMDADGQHNVKDALKGVVIMQRSNIDLLIGSRLIDAQNTL
jgi:glycosyltransferase involved in cell wall biosynthesis